MCNDGGEIVVDGAMPGPDIAIEFAFEAFNAEGVSYFLDTSDGLPIDVPCFPMIHTSGCLVCQSVACS